MTPRFVRPVVAAALLCAAVPSVAQMMTIGQARELPVRELARRVLGAAGALYAEVERPGAGAGRSYPAGGLVGLSFLSFAARPVSAGFEGLCEVAVASVSFRTIRRATEQDLDPPARVHRVHTNSLYRIVSDPDRRGEWTDRYSRQLDRECADQGPVFRTNEGGGRRFFSGRAYERFDFLAVDASFAARALRQVIRRAASGDLQPVCTPNPAFADGELCGEPLRRLARLDLAELSRVELTNCSASAPNLCVRAIFRLPGSGRFEWRELQVSIETNNAVVDPPPAQIEIRAVTLSGVLWQV